MNIQNPEDILQAHFQIALKTPFVFISSLPQIVDLVIFAVLFLVLDLCSISPLSITLIFKFAALFYNI